MTQQIITTTPANTGLGSSPKAAFDICNANFTDLYSGTPFTQLQTIAVDPALLNAASIVDNTNPVGASWLISQSVDATYNGVWGNIFQIASQITSTSTAPAVAVYGAGVGNGSGSSVWGANFAVVLNNSGATGIGIEVDVNMASAGTGTGVSINAVGANSGVAALQLNSNTIAGGWKFGINFNNTGHTAVGGASSALIQSLNSSAAFGINLSGSFTSSELTLPSFVVGATPASINSAIQVLGSASGSPSISAVGGATNIQLTLNGKGSGQVSMGSPLFLSAAAASNGGGLTLGSTQQTTVGATGAASALPANPLGYLIGFVGASKIAVPYYNG